MGRIFLSIFCSLAAAEEFAYVSSSGSYVSYLVKSLVFIICLLAFLFYWHKYWLPKMQSGAPGNLSLKERLVIEPGTTAYVLDSKGEYRLLIVSNKQIFCGALSGRKLKYQTLPKKDFAGYLKEMTQIKGLPKLPKILPKRKAHARP
ncbi:hypothetical protein NO2_1114 [Candidatus Termititenax persephonae]|uniref:Flagellar biosynthetic protein FliO n=1 Tax=Candidatus Termititenax persephonae TaxID=2218525 RepID=A0A388THH7_9BACT|nr:hypothetical protein NO2_1114 [Candidatus Termititenax persephonae]